MPPPPIPILPPPPTHTQHALRPPVLGHPTGDNQLDHMVQTVPHQQDPATPPETEGAWATTTWSRRSRKRGSATAHRQPPGMQGAVNLVPGSFSYATAAQQATKAAQPTHSGTMVPTPKNQDGTTLPWVQVAAALLPLITEVTVLRQGGHIDHQLELQTCA